MRLDWLFRERTRRSLPSPPIVLLGLLLLCLGLAATIPGDAMIFRIVSWRQAVGIMLMFVLMPPYLLAMMQFLQRRTLVAVEQLAPLADATATALVRTRLASFPPRAGAAVLLLSAIFGLDQNGRMAGWMADGQPFAAIDVFFVAGNVIVWTTVGFLLAWRVPASRALVDFGRSLNIDLYHLDALRPLARVATGDILVFMGAIALSTLQSLDAELRLENYASAFAVGGVSGAMLFLFPLWGVRANVMARKAERIAEIEGAMAATPRDDLRALELLAAHRERIAQLSNRPIDLSIVTRIFAYVIIPPLAWVAAALVERLVDSF